MASLHPDLRRNKAALSPFHCHLPMKLDKKVRLLQNKWIANQGWPQRLDSLEINEIHGWKRQRIDFKLAKSRVRETSASQFSDTTISRLSEIMGRAYASGRMAITDADVRRPVPVISTSGQDVSGFHQGAGEFTMTELLQADPPEHSL